jgi:multisubunit Na+/H+ antiporter MnhB subunit
MPWVGRVVRRSAIGAWLAMPDRDITGLLVCAGAILIFAIALYFQL